MLHARMDSELSEWQFSKSLPACCLILYNYLILLYIAFEYINFRNVFNFRAREKKK